MKNLLIFLDPAKKFIGEYSNLMKIQVDNSLSLGWSVNNIISATNFEYEYRGVRSIVVDDYETFDQHRSTKTVDRVACNDHRHSQCGARIPQWSFKTKKGR